MSVRSMTGYGHGVARAGGLRVDVEISSVNRKQLDISINLPKALGQLESRVHEEVAHALHRGRVSVDVTVRGSPELRRKAVRVDQRLAGAYLAELRRVARALKLTDDLGAALLLQLPGVLHFETLEDDVERIGPLLEQAVRGALAALGRMREREGGALARDLRKRLAVMARLAAELRKLAPPGGGPLPGRPVRTRGGREGVRRHPGRTAGAGDHHVRRQIGRDGGADAPGQPLRPGARVAEPARTGGQGA
jgi:uncharacterized protein (TIGR00255 family)